MAEKSFKVSLPGVLYQKNNRWWWKVKLPGETRLKALGLKAKGARFATTDLAEAEEVALGIWESAIRSQVQALARAKAREKAKAVAKEMAAVRAEADDIVARLKAKITDTVANAKTQCEEKLRQCNAVTEQADERIRAESEKRAAVEAECEEKLRQCKEALAQAEEHAKAESEERAAVEAEYEEKFRRCEEALAQAQEPVGTELQQPIEAQAELEMPLVEPTPTGACDCCGKADVPEDELSTIDSGHRVCADCLASMRG